MIWFQLGVLWDTNIPQYYHNILSECRRPMHLLMDVSGRAGDAGYLGQASSDNSDSLSCQIRRLLYGDPKFKIAKEL